MEHVYPIFIDFDLFQDGCGPGIIVPESGGKGQLLVVVDFRFSVSDVKETSSRPGCGPSYL